MMAELGNDGWHRALQNEVQTSQYLEVKADAQGDLLVARAFDDASAPVPPLELTCVIGDCLLSGSHRTLLQKVDASGELRWSLYFESGYDVGLAVSPLDGRVYAVGAEHAEIPGTGGNTDRESSEWGEADIADGTLIEVDSDGARCRKLGYAGIPKVTALAAAPDGSLYFRSRKAFGRLGVPRSQ